jgi:hypothetical protein
VRSYELLITYKVLTFIHFTHAFVPLIVIPDSKHGESPFLAVPLISRNYPCAKTSSDHEERVHLHLPLHCLPFSELGIYLNCVGLICI